MKKILLLLCVAFMFSLSACGDNEEKKDLKSETSAVTEEEKASVVINFRDEKGNVLITNDDIESAKLSKTDSQDDDSYLVEITFTDEGSKKLEEATKELLGETLNIYVDDKLIISPKINNVITDGRTVITGLTYDEAVGIVDNFTLEK